MLPLLSCPPVSYVDRCWTEVSLARSMATATQEQSRNHTDTLPTLAAAELRAARAPRLSPFHKPLLNEEMRATASRHVSRRWQHPTTGAVAIHVALQLCERVAIYGFGNTSCYGKVRHTGRYYERTVGIKNYLTFMARFHDYAAQHLWLQHLVRDEGSSVIDAEGCFT